MLTHFYGTVKEGRAKNLRKDAALELVSAYT